MSFRSLIVRCLHQNRTPGDYDRRQQAHCRRLTSKAHIWLVAPALFGLIAWGQSAAQPAVPTVSTATSACEAQRPGGGLFITESCVDPVLNQPYVDIRREGTLTDPQTNITVNFLYVHGGFTGTSARFAFYFPAAEHYQGRFFQTTYPTLGQEDAQPGCAQVGTSACSVVFAISNGAYVVSSNNAGGLPAGGPLAAYRANAAAAKYSRIVAQELYQTTERPRGYIYGASGGGYQTVGSLENTSGVWDGGVPMVFGAPNAIPSFFGAQALAARVLRDRLPQIADAMEPGGSGNPFAGLTADERSVLAEVSRIGVPLRGWWNHQTAGATLAGFVGMVRGMDPTYADDFWSQPGYAGSDPAVQAARSRFDTRVASVEGANTIVLADAPQGSVFELEITSGPRSGQSIPVFRATGATMMVMSNNGIEPGVSVRIDNSWLIALQYYHRHQIPTPLEHGWEQFINASGEPIYPQRERVIGPGVSAASAGSIANGDFHGKMIMVESVIDMAAYAWSGDWYLQQAQGLQGARLNDNFRLWYTDNADHGPDLYGIESGIGFGMAGNAASHIVGYIGIVQQALLDLDAWVLSGTAPPRTSNYRLDQYNQIHLATTASAIGGVQPIVSLNAASGGRGARSNIVEVAVGQPVILYVDAEAPRGAGNVVQVEWNIDGVSRYTTHPLTRSQRRVRVQETFTPTRPGTFFPAVRVTSARNGDLNAQYGRAQNLARVRVVAVGEVITPAGAQSAPAATQDQTGAPFSVDSTVHELLANPAATAVLERHLTTQFTQNPIIGQFGDMTLRALAQTAPVLTPDLLAQLNAELAAVR